MTLRFDRRELLQWIGAGLGASTLMAVGGCGTGPLASEEAQPLSRAGFIPDAELELTAMDRLVSILPGSPTRVWKYEGKLLKGDPGILQVIPGTYLGPIIRVRRGQKIRIHLVNKLPEPTITHWHGLHVPSDMDGHPRFSVPPGKSYVYDLEIRNRAGTYWFHPHPHQRTGFQAYAGLAGLFLVSDDEEAAANLPTGEFDLPLVIQDRAFNAANELVYVTNPMDQMIGMLGDRIFVNGQPDFVLNVAARSYRLRLLNGSNSRVYKLAWDDDAPLVVIATDGGLLENPVRRNYVTLAPGERVELWADFSGRRVGSEVKLKSLAFSGAASGMMAGGMMQRGMMGANPAALPDGAEFTVLGARITRDTSESSPMPGRLSTIPRFRLEDAVNARSPKVIGIAMRGMMSWSLNGRVFEMEAVASSEIVRLNTIEAWELDNQAGGMMQMAHPMHIHGVQCQVLDRRIAPPFEAAWETVRDGYVDEGWKDTVLLWPGERVRLLMRFEDYAGLFMYHCHNLEHEDRGLMRNYRVQS